MEASLATLADWCGGRLERADPAAWVTGVCIDSRAARPGDLFVALAGTRADGHRFVADALAHGAAAALVERTDILPEDAPRLVVPDAVAALGDIAHRYRWTEPLIPWIAVTGSNGKTTTREMTAHLCARRGPVRTSVRNYNNHLGLPLSMLSPPENAWVGVVELGTSARGEIAKLAGIVTPTVAIVTNAGPSHLENLVDVGRVAREKAAIFDRLPPDGLAVYPVDDPNADVFQRHCRVPYATFGVDTAADMVAENVEATEGGTRFVVRGVRFELPLLGRHNVKNCLAALLAAERVGVGLQEAAAALREILPVPGRLQRFGTAYLTIIDDAYNANPASLDAAMEVLADSDGARRVAVVGDMLELGPHSREWHREAGQRMIRHAPDVLLAVGRETLALAEEVDRMCPHTAVKHFPNAQALVRVLPLEIDAGDVVLVKGSRGMRLEEVVAALRDWTPAN